MSIVSIPMPKSSHSFSMHTYERYNNTVRISDENKTSDIIVGYSFVFHSVVLAYKCNCEWIKSLCGLSARYPCWFWFFVWVMVRIAYCEFNGVFGPYTIRALALVHFDNLLLFKKFEREQEREERESERFFLER